MGVSRARDGRGGDVDRPGHVSDDGADHHGVETTLQEHGGHQLPADTASGLHGMASCRRDSGLYSAGKSCLVGPILDDRLKETFLKP